ncbi:Mis6-domain-containing protein [Basidiobolus meristosporus CBS 931.73]|uniref:Mis6-domain-containing protein n=1 Tax=Basidiobolus meristosporus CBS 931.73 TaxID=1314790 RepID=A0A1Y1ZB45_9FUNG|nr:Mis6-domain-containing protein [Basidiobolus meristosporus CBS 931.73]|eukprot:ORY07324.1 Mis6-domain-containing protein [Basidiobolus meristosporus CBS 931.73]
MEQRIVAILEALETTLKATGPDASVELNLDFLHQLSSQCGLEPRQIQTLLDLALTSNIGSANAVRLIKAMFPREAVPERVAIRVLGVLSTRLDPTVKLCLLQWMIMVFDRIESKSGLKRLYGVVFRLLDHDQLRHTACHLLFLLTAQEHVKHFRAQKLIELYHRVGPEPGLCAVLGVYKDYCPELIDLPIDIPNYVFKAPDAAWAECLFSIGQNHPNNPGFAINLSGGKETLMAGQSTVESVMRKFHSKELPQQFASVLEDRLIQLFITSRPYEGSFNRIGTWACNYLSNLAIWRDQTNSTRVQLQELLTKICSAVEYNERLFPLFEKFLANYLCYWDGDSHQKEIFTMISHLPLKPFHELRGKFLDCLYKLYVTSSETWKATLIEAYTRLLRNWSIAEYTTPHPDPNFRTSQIKQMAALANHVETISAIGLEVEESSIHLIHRVLEFYEEITAFSLERGVPLVHIPNSHIVCHCMFHVSMMPISRICGILYRCKASYEIQRELKTSSGAFSVGYERDHVTKINSHIMDICNCIWRGQALTQGVPYTNGFGLDRDTVQELEQLGASLGLTFSSAFGLTQSPAFLPLSLTFLRSLEDRARVTVHHRGPISSASLRLLQQQRDTLQLSHTNFRLQYLDFLLENHCTGLYHFLYATMTSLMNHRRDTSVMPRRLL